MKQLAQNLVSIAAFLILWEYVSRSGLVSSALFPAPSAVATAMLNWARTGEMLADSIASLWRALAGLAFGVLFGTVLGVMAGRIALLRNILVPIVNLFRPIPPVAMIPLVIVWFGIGDLSKIASTAFACFFPMFTAAFQGAVNIPDSFLWAAKSAGLTHAAILRRIVFPATLNVGIAGLRVSIAIAFVMVFVNELAGASQGLGYQISLMHLNYRIDRMMAALIVLAACAAVVDLLALRFIQFACPWIGRETPK